MEGKIEETGDRSERKDKTEREVMENGKHTRGKADKRNREEWKVDGKCQVLKSIQALRQSKNSRDRREVRKTRERMGSTTVSGQRRW